MAPSITLITPTFNSVATLADTLDSVAAQTRPPLEHLIIDGGSRDGTVGLAQRYAHVGQIVSEADRGLYDAMNKGLALAQGDIVGILNGDDFYAHPRVLEHVAARFAQTGADALYGDLEYVDPGRISRVVRYWRAGEYRPGKFYRGWMPPHPTFFVRREVYARYGCFNLDLRFAADYELMLRFIERYRVPVCYLPEVLVRMRTGGVSNASLRNRWRANREDRKAWDINGLRPRFYTVYWKPLSKIRQLLR